MKHKIKDRYSFQGLPISVENPKGSVRHWHDEEANESGQTKMLYDYGYVRGTLGLDDDEVDVFVGPSKDSDRVFIITQMKKPEFKEVDEQKVMVGWDNPEEAKKAYLKHFNSPKFFGSMTECSVEEFKKKLKSHKGSLIKALADINNSAKLVVSSESFMKSVDILKGISANMASALAGRQRQIQERAAARQAHVERMAGMAPVASETPYSLGTIRPQPADEPPIVPVRSIPFRPSHVSMGEISKSEPIKEHTPEYRYRDVEAKPYWKR